MSNEQGGKFILLKGKKGITGAVTITVATELFTLNNHGLRNGDKVAFSNIVNATGISASPVEYYVVNKTTNTFQISLTKGGTVVAIGGTDGTADLEDVFQIFGGLRSKSITINSEEIDVTNHDSDEWKTLLDTAGIRSAALSGETVWIDADNVIKNMRSKMMANTLVSLQVIVSDSGSYFQGSFKLTELGVSGDYNAEATGSISASSSGEVTYTAV